MWRVGQVLGPSVRSMLLVCSGICGGGCAAEMIVRTKTPYALYFPPSRPSILSTFTVIVTTRSTTPMVFGFFGGFFPFYFVRGLLYGLYGSLHPSV